MHKILLFFFLILPLCSTLGCGKSLEIKPSGQITIGGGVTGSVKK